VSRRPSHIETLTSKIIKILRITNEPLSAHAISDTYKFNYKEVQEVLRKLEDDGVLTSLKTKGGLFYFIPNKYFKRNVTIDSDENIPFIWLEDLSNEELNYRKEKLVGDLQQLKEGFSEQKIDGKSFFEFSQKKKEELMLINQIMEDRKTASQKKCMHCEEIIKDEDLNQCPNCRKELLECIVCKQKIYFAEKTKECPHCLKLAHNTHLLEWIKTYGHCPSCKQSIVEKGD